VLTQLEGKPGKGGRTVGHCRSVAAPYKITAVQVAARQAAE